MRSDSGVGSGDTSGPGRRGRPAARASRRYPREHGHQVPGGRSDNEVGRDAQSLEHRSRREAARRLDQVHTHPIHRANRPQARDPAAAQSCSPASLRQVLHALAVAWAMLAAVLGRLARALGTGAREVDLTHRRDGIGLALFTATVVVAAVVWFSIDGWLTGVVTTVVTGAFGALDVVVPALLGWATLRVLRHPDQNEATGRVAIGAAITLAAVCGLWALSHGAPEPGDGQEAMRAAGGWLGWLVTAPAVAAVGTWLAYVWLAALLGFGLLVMTATPLHAVPERLATARDILLLRHTPQEADATGDMAVDRAARDATLEPPERCCGIGDGDESGGSAAEAGAPPAGAAAGVAGMLAAVGRRAGGLLRGRSKSGGEDEKPFDGPLAGDEAFATPLAGSTGTDDESATSDDATLVDGNAAHRPAGDTASGSAGAGESGDRRGA